MLLLGFAVVLFRGATPTAPDVDAGRPLAKGPAPRPAEGEVPGVPYASGDGGRPTVVAVGRPASPARAVRPPRPRFQAATLRASLPPTRVPTDLIVAYGAEVEPIDRLLRALRRVSRETSGERPPRQEGSAQETGRTTDDQVREQIEALEALRADVMAELVIEAQARAAAPWK
jgi:hypothetical protein